MRRRGLRRSLEGRVGTFIDLTQRWRQMLAHFARKQKAELREGNSVALYTEHAELLAAMRTLIAGARRSIDLEMYIWVDDEVGHEFVGLLREACRRGVSVRVVYDALGSFRDGADIEAALLAAGARVHAFHPLVPWRLRGNPNDRNHRKLLVVDDSLAIMTSGNWSLDYDSARRPRGFVDVGIAVTGALVTDLAVDFRRVWKAKTGEELAPPLPRLGDVRLPGASLPGVTAQLVSGIRRGERSAIRRLYLLVFGGARRDIWLANAYFVPGLRLLAAIRHAARRGVDVRLVVPGMTDLPWVQRATRATYETLLRAGARVYERQERMMHAKVAAVDGELAVVGTANIDPRSFLHNLELNVNLHDDRLAAVVRAFVEEEIGRSVEVRLRDVRARPLMTRLLYRLAYAFAYWL